jgi:hypothetical protein
MQIIGFNFTKISAVKSPSFKRSNLSTNISFSNVEKQKTDMLKDSEATKISFKFSINYDEENEKKKEDKKLIVKKLLKLMEKKMMNLFMKIKLLSKKL